MDAITVKHLLEKKILQLEELTDKIEQYSHDKAAALATYDKELSLTILKLKNKLITEFEGIKIDSLPATLIPAIAKGIVYQEKYSAEEAEGLYKSIVVRIESLKAQLNGYQSLNKFHD